MKSIRPNQSRDGRMVLPIWRDGHRFLRVALGLIGLGFVARTLFVNWRDVPQPLAEPQLLLASLLVMIVATALLSQSWVSLSSSMPRFGLHRVFIISLLGKYIPGGIGQPAAQVIYGSAHAMPPRQTAVMFVLHSLAQVIAGGAIAGLLLVSRPDLSPWLPMFLVVWLGLAILFMNRRAVASLVDRLDPRESFEFEARRWPTVAVRCVAWALLSLAGHGYAFALVLQGLGADSGGVAIAMGFVAGWLVGFVTIPFPAGLGVREAVLLLLIPNPAGMIMAASVTFRIVALLAEVLMMVFSLVFFPLIYADHVDEQR